ncbi:MAG: nuclear transport factor 2 family protein [Planctomycetota bacterium]
MSMKADVENMNALTLQGKWKEAIEKYYADDAVRKVSGLVPLVGKDMIREQVEDFIKGCTEFHSFEIKAVAIDEEDNVSMVEQFVEWTHKFYGHVRQTHVAVQRWRNGTIYEESIYIMQERANN